MAENSQIEWTDHTFNPWIGCTKVSPGCDHCYAERDMDHRFGRVTWGPQGARVRTRPANWRKPLAWNAQHAEFYAKHGRRQRVFCASLADVFDNQVEASWRNAFFDLIEATPNLDWLLLTKRISNVRWFAPYSWIEQGNWPANVWLGATIVNQAEADRDIPKLLEVPARVRFLSMEPLLGPVDLRLMARSFGFPKHIARDGRAVGMPQGLHWVIVGGESGPQARPMSIQWVRELRHQCYMAGVPFLFKQWGEWAPADMVPAETAGRYAFGDYEHDRARFVQTKHYPRAFDRFGARCVLKRVGKKAAGRLLDGVRHDGYPEVS